MSAPKQPPPPQTPGGENIAQPPLRFRTRDLGGFSEARIERARRIHREPLLDFFTGVTFGAAVAVLFWTLLGR